VRATVRFVLLALAFAGGTYVIGWWALPLVGAVWGFIVRERWIGVRAGAAAAAGWGLLLAWTALTGPLAELAAKAAEIMGFSPAVWFTVTLVFAALAAGATAGLVSSLRGADTAGPVVG